MIIIKGNKLQKNKAQSIIEYSVLLGLVVAAFVGMQVYLKRGIQAAVKISADQLGSQQYGLSEVELREGYVEKTSPEKPASVSSKVKVTRGVSRGGRHTLESQNQSNIVSDYISKRKDDGWYYVPSGTGLELRRQETE